MSITLGHLSRQGGDDEPEPKPAREKKNKAKSRHQVRIDEARNHISRQQISQASKVLHGLPASAKDTPEVQAMLQEIETQNRILDYRLGSVDRSSPELQRLRSKIGVKRHGVRTHRRLVPSLFYTFLAVLGGLAVLIFYRAHTDRAAIETSQPGREDIVAREARLIPATPPPERTSEPLQPAPAIEEPLVTASPTIAPQRAPAPTFKPPRIPVNVAGTRAFQEGDETVVTFDEGMFAMGYTLKPEAADVLIAVAGEFTRLVNHLHITVVGHTDDTPLRTSQLYDSHEQLGFLRAKAVISFFKNSTHLPDRILKAESAGNINPPYPNDSAANRDRNRTVSLRVVRK